MFDVLQAQENPGQFFPLAAVETHGGANAARAEKPRLGLSSFKTASHLGFAVCNSTTALGLQAGWAENRGGAYRWARYYNSLTGRFLSRDPDTGKPVDPKTLHKYLYANGDPINGIDPRGREDLIEYANQVYIYVNYYVPTFVGVYRFYGTIAGLLGAASGWWCEVTDGCGFQPVDPGPGPFEPEGPPPIAPGGAGAQR